MYILRATRPVIPRSSHPCCACYAHVSGRGKTRARTRPSVQYTAVVRCQESAGVGRIAQETLLQYNNYTSVLQVRIACQRLVQHAAPYWPGLCVSPGRQSFRGEFQIIVACSCYAYKTLVSAKTSFPSTEIVLRIIIIRTFFVCEYGERSCFARRNVYRRLLFAIASFTVYTRNGFETSNLLIQPEKRSGHIELTRLFATSKSGKKDVQTQNNNCY